MKNNRFLSMALVLFLSSSAMLFAQGTKDESRPMKRNNEYKQMPRMSEEQKAALMEVKGKYGEDLKQLKLEIAELQARQKTLLGNESPDERKLLSNAATLVEKRGVMSKKLLAMRLETRSLLKRDGEQAHGPKRFHRDGDSMKPGNRKGRIQGNDKLRAGADRKGMDRFASRAEKGHMARQGVKTDRKNRDGQRQMAQGMKQRKPNGGSERGAFFTEEQQEAMKELRLSNYQQVTDLKNELNELKVHQRTILAQKEVDVKAANKNIDAMTDLKVELAKLQLKSKIAMKDLLTDEQKAKMGHRDFKRRGHARSLRS